jgi:hypothetical protein
MLAVNYPVRQMSRRYATLMSSVFLSVLFATTGLAKNAMAATHITSDITTNTTWTSAGSPYLLDKQIKLASGVTLTIQPSVEVQFNATSTLTLFVMGSLNAIGTETSPITFTSSQGAKGEGKPGQYKGINVQGATASAHFSFAHFYYGGTGSGGLYNYGELTSQSGASLEVDHSIFAHNSYAGLLLAGTGSTAVSHSSFVENGDGISQINLTPGSFTLSHSYVTDNTQDGLFFDFLKESKSGATIENNEITRNGRAGLYIEAECATATAGFPHGNGNDIFGNGPSAEFPPDGSAIKTLYTCEALNVDWTGNYWGNVYFIAGPEPLLLHLPWACKGLYPSEWYEAASSQSSGYLAYSAYETNALVPPPGPISTKSYTIFEPIVCADKTVENIAIRQVYNAFYLAPGEISAEEIPIS